ncbi:hypothetical protein F503_01511 [Ophiostoma piceae UAMH 11346]|uniref:Transmembrane protein n=1 Tax=Ophiostoma piceae (strain UAMH 11346) TaxID=1262450 RepID=S3CRB7_OPHP1|nr:hypothetical protein F503_01511 [Ophiostoma piceae UAMH 11346]
MSAIASKYVQQQPPPRAYQPSNTYRAIGPIVSIGAASVVASYVYTQLHSESATMDRFFASYHTPESEASRQRVFDGAIEDPRKNVLNFLSWK